MNQKLYKTIDSSINQLFSIKTSRTYYYIDIYDNVKMAKELIEKETEKNRNYILEEKEESDFWDKNNVEVYLDLDVRLMNSNSLFGKNGICGSDGKLGVGLVYHAINSRVKECKKIGEFTSKDNNVDFHCNNILLSNLKSSIEFNIVIYLIEAGIDDSLSCFGKESGLIMYENTEWTLVGDNNGSIFPIFEDVLDNNILWSYKCEFDDIYEDSFTEENISIYLNKKHSLYPYYQINHQLYNHEMMAQLLSTIFTILILDIRSKLENNYFQAYKGEPNSIQTAIIYYKDQFGFKINGSHTDLLESIQKFFFKEFK